jgi:hypothetical protein
MGTYTANTFPNPVIGQNTAITAGDVFKTSGEMSTFGWPNIGEMYFDPNEYAPGSLGKVVTYSKAAGPFKNVAIYSELDHFLQNEYDAFRGLYTTYAARKTVYDAKVVIYNDALRINSDTGNKAPEPFTFLSFLVAPQIVPTRPCKPDQPKSPWGQMLDFNLAGDWATFSGITGEQTLLRN